MSEWREVKLGDVINLKRGYDLPSHLRQEGSVPIFSSSGISGFHNDEKIQGPGVITGRYGTIGQVFLANLHFGRSIPRCMSKILKETMKFSFTIF